MGMIGIDCMKVVKIRGYNVIIDKVELKMAA